MPRLKKVYSPATIVSLALFSLLTTLSAGKELLASGEEEFSVDYFVTYDLKNPRKATVDFQVAITNLNAKSFVKDYTLDISGGRLDNISTASLSNRPIPFTIEENNNTSKIKTTFDDKAVGKGAKQVWKIFYEDKNIIRKNGLVWNIAIPKFKNIPGLAAYTVKLIVPESLGPEIFSSPMPAKTEKRTGGIKIYYFDDPNLKNSGAILSFGVSQLYEFKLKYHLKNPNIFPTTVKITLPPNIRSEQEVILQNLSPRPRTTFFDEDGNFYAEYILNNSKEIVVEADGLARVFNPPRELSASGKTSEIPPSLKEAYLKSQPYWETDDPEIKRIVRDNFDPNQTVSQNARRLFEFTVKNLKYNPGRINDNLIRFGAKKSLQDKENAVCMEFADLLTTLLRAGGIPAEVLEGYAFTEDETAQPVVGDVLHSWVRYYDPRIGWISVDPTWSATSGLDYFSRLDTNHLVFAIKGASSLKPYPAGAYKISPSQTGDIKVSLKERDVEVPAAKIEMGTAGNLLLVINKGATTIFDAKIKIQNPEKEERLGDLPPLSRKEIKLNLRRRFLEVEQKQSLTADLSFTDFNGRFKNLTWRGNGLDEGSTFALPAAALGIPAALGLLAYLTLRHRRPPRRK